MTTATGSGTPEPPGLEEAGRVPSYRLGRQQGSVNPLTLNFWPLEP